jgi:hypothetical protein
MRSMLKISSGLIANGHAGLGLPTYIKTTSLYLKLVNPPTILFRSAIGCSNNMNLPFILGLGKLLKCSATGYIRLNPRANVGR